MAVRPHHFWLVKAAITYSTRFSCSAIAMTYNAGMNLTDRWEQTWTDLALSHPDSQLRDVLFDCYREPHRAYHTLHHLEECFEQFDSISSLCAYPGRSSWHCGFTMRSTTLQPPIMK